MTSSAALTFLETLARTAGEVILPYFQQPDLRVEFKSDDTPVTVADRRAEEVMRSLIEKQYPQHGIVGEEWGNTHPDAEFVWVLDPIDGTKSFVAGVPLFGVLIGLLHEGKPMAGCIYQPVLNEMCLGDGTQTTLNGRPVRVRKGVPLERALVLCTDVASVAQAQDITRFEHLRKQAGLFRTWGDCYGYLMLAAGRADVMLDPIMNPWDLLPVIPVIEGAGGVITGWDGGSAKDSAIAAGSELHPEVVRLLAA
jgi:histidinol phosphatase-like enzyme (inositol monophosphatase family)